MHGPHARHHNNHNHHHRVHHGKAKPVRVRIRPVHGFEHHEEQAFEKEAGCGGRMVCVLVVLGLLVLCVIGLSCGGVLCSSMFERKNNTATPKTASVSKPKPAASSDSDSSPCWPPVSSPKLAAVSTSVPRPAATPVANSSEQQAEKPAKKGFLSRLKNKLSRKKSKAAAPEQQAEKPAKTGFLGKLKNKLSRKKSKAAAPEQQTEKPAKRGFLSKLGRLFSKKETDDSDDSEEGMHQCPRCKGKGRNGFFRRKCEVCDGKGELTKEEEGQVRDARKAYRQIGKNTRKRYKLKELKGKAMQERKKYYKSINDEVLYQRQIDACIRFTYDEGQDYLREQNAFDEKCKNYGWSQTTWKRGSCWLRGSFPGDNRRLMSVMAVPSCPEASQSTSSIESNGLAAGLILVSVMILFWIFASRTRNTQKHVSRCSLSEAELIV